MKNRTNIPVERKTYKVLLKMKLEKQGEVGKHITWDGFLLDLVKRK